MRWGNQTSANHGAYQDQYQAQGRTWGSIPFKFHLHKNASKGGGRDVYSLLPHSLCCATSVQGRSEIGCRRIVCGL